MAIQNDLGKIGEEKAAAYLERKGFKILHRNWRYPPYEIDLIAQKEEMVHFIEVKCRSSQDFGPPEDGVNRKKIRFLLRAVEEFLFRHREYRDFRLDILSISLHPFADDEFYFIEDVSL